MTTELTAYVIQGLWTVWMLFWLVAAFRTKKAQIREPVGSRLRYQALILIGLLHLFVGLTDLDDDAELFARTSGFHFVCAEMVALGLGWTLYARWHLGRNWSGTVQLKQDHQLIRSGPYRYTRHPIYTGLFLALAGFALFLDRWESLPGYLFVVAGFRMKIAREERVMHQQFGPDYEAYRAAVPMLLPRLA